MPSTVLVTGGSGYIAGFLIRQLVAEGWTVHTTVRDLGKEAAVRKLLAVDDAKLHFFAADLNADAGWAQAAQGCTWRPCTTGWASCWCSCASTACSPTLLTTCT